MRKIWPTLYNVDKSGTVREWTVSVDDIYIITEHGVMGGEIQESRKEAKLRRYTPEEEAQALFDRRLRIKYFRTIEEAHQPQLRPMLAHKLEEDKYSLPAYLQPKLDGMRCLAFRDSEGIQMISRGNKQFEYMTHLKEQLQWLPEGIVLDGELYIHGYDFQTLSSWIRGDHPENEFIEYHVYDIPVYEGIAGQPYQQRLENLINLFMTLKIQKVHIERIRLVETCIASTEFTMMELHKRFVNNGYEGSMYRDPNGVYEFGQRSWGLLKIKNFDDAEFKIVSIDEGRGKFEGLAVFTCLTPEGEMFDCVIKGNEFERARYYRERDKYLGKYMTVKYQGLSNKGIPRFPVGLRIREDDEWKDNPQNTFEEISKLQTEIKEKGSEL